MPGALVNFDKALFLELNHFSAPWADPVMRLLSGPVPWILFVLTLLGIIWIKPKPGIWKRNLIIMTGLLLAVAVSEQASVHLFKEVFMRLRPCHDPDLAGKVRLVMDSCGGQYGFVSTHATNAFTLAVASSLLLSRRWFTVSIITWALLVSYSRIYVGVHFPGDVLGGTLLGIAIGFIAYRTINILFKKLKETKAPTNYEKG